MTTRLIHSLVFSIVVVIVVIDSTRSARFRRLLDARPGASRRLGSGDTNFRDDT